MLIFTATLIAMKTVKHNWVDNKMIEAGKALSQASVESASSSKAQ